MQSGPADPNAERAFLRHPDVRALLEEDGTGAGPDEVIRRRARALVQRASADVWTGPPFDMKLLASLEGYRVQDRDEAHDSLDGQINPKGGTIDIDPRIPPARQRFTIAHELAHTLFPTFKTVMKREHAEMEERLGPQSPVEQLCNIAAAEFLMPLEPFHAAVGTGPISVDGVVRVAELFEVSAEAAARRWVALSTTGTSLVVARPMPPDGHLTVIASVRGGTGKPLYLPWSKVLPADSVAYRVWAQAHTTSRRPCVAEAVEYWGGLGRLGRRRVQAVANPLSWPTPESVLCLLHELPRS